jgi:hypothetical protein
MFVTDRLNGAVTLVVVAVLSVCCGGGGPNTTDTHSGETFVGDVRGADAASEDRSAVPDAGREAGRSADSAADVPVSRDDGGAQDSDAGGWPSDVSDMSPAPDSLPEVGADTLVTDVPGEVAPPGPGDPWKFVVLLSGALVGKEHGGHGDHLLVECLAVDGEGMPLPAPDDLLIMTDAPTATIDGAKLSFPARGQWEVTCHSDSLGIDGAAVVSVPTAALDKQFTSAARRLGTVHLSLAHLLKAAAAEESPNVGTICQQLVDLAAQCEPEELDNTALLLPYPGGWPELQSLVDAGLDTNADDSEWEDTLTAVNGKLDEIAAALETLAADVSEENAALLEAKTTAFAQLVDTLAGLDPSAIAIYEHLELLRQLMGPKMDRVTQWTAQAVGAGCVDERWTLQEVMTTVAIKSILAAIPSYNDCLKEASKAGTQLLIMLELFEVVQEMGASGTPVIYVIYGPGAQVVNPGLKWTINGGGFAWEANMNIIMFVPPEVAKNAADQVYAIVDFFQNLYNFFDGMVGDPSGEFEDFWDWINTGQDLADTINEEVNDLVFGDEACAQNYQLVPYKVDGEPDNQTLYFNEFPSKVNCSFIPQDSIMVPINLLTGNGEAQLVLVTKEQPGSCNCP